ncbi:PoNe immunity protein domain-containing protein [Psychrobacillus sp. FSL W7-1457]|uniref:PoNe immunity protein domain-containing protein n=1 Tax=unclassified Psychrobacillus TaxID=2636677 RepID=UPI0030FAF0D4
MRDFLCDLEYLKETIDFKEKLIKEKNNKIERIKQDVKENIQRYPLDNEQIIFNTRSSLFQLYTELIRAKYSIGRACADLEEDYLEALMMLEYIGYKKVRYVNFIWMVALGILLETDKENIRRLAKIADGEHVDDVLLDYLLYSYKIERKIKSSQFELKKPYSKSLEIIELSFRNKVEASTRIEKYIEKEWFQGHYSYGWKNSHKEPGYLGFWSFETAALAKILKLDDSTLKANNHYPYDLAHYKKDMIFNIEPLKQLEKDEPSSMEEDYHFGIECNRNLEQIIPRKYHQMVNQIIEDYENISSSEFWNKYNLKDIWFEEEEFVREKNTKDLLGTLIVFALVDQEYILQLDYKEKVEDYMDDIPNDWLEQEVKLVRLEMDNDQDYYMYIPVSVQMKNLYEVRIINGL